MTVSLTRRGDAEVIRYPDVVRITSDGWCLFLFGADQPIQAWRWLSLGDVLIEAEP
jgi:hypothetical protein